MWGIALGAIGLVRGGWILSGSTGVMGGCYQSKEVNPKEKQCLNNGFSWPLFPSLCSVFSNDFLWCNTLQCPLLDILLTEKHNCACTSQALDQCGFVVLVIFNAWMQIWAWPGCKALRSGWKLCCERLVRWRDWKICSCPFAVEGEPWYISHCSMIYLPLLKPVCVSTLAFACRILPGRKCLFAFAGLRGFQSMRFSYQMWILSEIVGISCAHMGWVGLRTK